MANMENYESLKNNESIKSDESLQKLIKEIDEIKDLTDSNDDKIDNVMKDWESVEWAESPSRVLDKWLSKSLMKCDENVLNTLINEVDNLLDSNPNVEWLSDLSKLLKEVKNNREKWNEDSFNKFKDIINKGNLSDLNSLKNEVQNIISFVNDDKNNITTLNLYANMVSLSPDAYKSFKSTDQKVYKDISDAIRNHFNMPEWAGVETAQKIQLEKIFDGMEDENVKKEDLQKLYEEYVWWEWNEEPIPEDGSVKFNKQVIVSSQDFAKKFNEINWSIPAENNDDVRKGTWELVNEGGEWDWGFEDVDIKEWLAVDEINKYVTDNWGKAIFRKKEQWEWTENKEWWYECNMENVKDFLKKIWNDIKFDKDFVAVKTPSRKAWLSSVQILLNKENEGSLKVDWQYVRWGETYTAVKNFQEKYNADNKLKEWDEGYLVTDWIPGPKTLAKLLDDKQQEEQQWDKQQEEQQWDKQQEEQQWNKQQEEQQWDKQQEEQQWEQIQDSPDLWEYGNSKMAGYPSENNITRWTADISTSGNVVNQWKQIEESVKTPEKSWIEGVWKFEWWKFIFNEGMEQTDDAGRSYITINNEKYTKFSDIGLSDWESGKVYQESKDWIYFGEVVWGKYTRSWFWTMLFSNWDTFVWNWENGSLNWEGTLTKVDGTKISWNWENGEFKWNNSMVAEKPVKIDESRIDYDNNLNAQILDSEVVSDNSQKGADNAWVDKSYDEAMQKKFEAITGVERDGTYSENQADADVSKIEASNLQW